MDFERLCFEYNLSKSFASQNIQLKHTLTKQCDPKVLITAEVPGILWCLFKTK